MIPKLDPVDVLIDGLAQATDDAKIRNPIRDDIATRDPGRMGAVVEEIELHCQAWLRGELRTVALISLITEALCQANPHLQGE